MELSNTNIHNIKINYYIKKVHSKLYIKYSSNPKFNYNLFLINTILSNSKCHIVALFKDHLLYDENAEFMKRYYKQNEITTKLFKIFNFYSKNSIIYPNYSSLVESKYLYYNIIKKQMIMNKISNERKKLKKLKKISVNKYDDSFFSNTIYNDILNESKSFMSFLFGEEGKSKEKDKKINDKIENEKEIQDFTKIIDNIQKTEVTKKNNLDFILKSNEKRSTKINYKKPDLVDISTNSSTKFNKNRNKMYYINNINNNLNSLFIKSTTNSTKSGTNSIVNTVQNQKYFLNKNNKNNINKNMKNNRSSFKNENIYKKINNISYNNTLKENINNNEMYIKNTKQDKIIYHRKVNSSLIGNYLKRLDLPSNLSLINSLKIANETFGDAQLNKLNNIKFHKKFKNINIKNQYPENDKNDLTSPKSKIINLPKNIHSNIINEKNDINKKNKTLKGKGNTIIKLTKFKTNSKKIEIPLFTSKHLYCFARKRKSPIYIRNHIPVKFFNNSNGEINNNTSLNTLLYTYRKPENRYKSIRTNPNMTSPYSKPKGLFRDKKCLNISARKLFSNSLNCLSLEKNKHK